MRSFLNESDFLKGNKAEDLVKEYGTPLYVYNEDIIREHMRNVAGIVKNHPYTANYSVKANTNISILKLALDEGLNADAMSEGEMRVLLEAGFSADRIFFVPNNVDIEEIKFAVDNKIIVSLDSLSQLELFGKNFPGHSCAVRINPGVGAGHHEKVVTAGKKTKFGIAEEDIDEIFVIAKKYNLTIAGINQHVGSLFMNPQPFLDAVDNFLRVAKKFENLQFIDFGGGYGIPYHKLDGEECFDMDDFSKRFNEKVDKFVEEYGSCPLFKSEPGRYCVAQGGIILGRVHSIKQNAGYEYAGTDVGMNVLIRPSMYDSWHDIEVLRDSEVVLADDDDCRMITITGNICESGDILGKNRMMPPMSEGDLVAVLDAGAYGYSMSSNYNTRRRPAEVMIMSDKSVKLIRKRETYDDLIRLMRV